MQDGAHSAQDLNFCAFHIDLDEVRRINMVARDQRVERIDPHHNSTRFVWRPSNLTEHGAPDMAREQEFGRARVIGQGSAMDRNVLETVEPSIPSHSPSIPWHWFDRVNTAGCPN